MSEKMTGNVFFAANGSAALDLGRFASPAYAPQPRRETPAEPKIRVSPRPKEETKLQVPLFGVIGIIVCLVLALMVVQTGMLINETNTKAVAAARELQALEKQEREMNSAFEGMVDMEMVEAVAAGELMMAAPGSDQIVYLDLSGGDKAESFVRQDGLLDRLKAFFVGIAG